MTPSSLDPPGPVAGSYSRAGLQRAVNEDHLATPEGLDPELLARRGYLYLVADGIGGQSAGEQASALAVSTVMEAYYGPRSEVNGLWSGLRTKDQGLRTMDQPGQALVAAIRQANAVLHRQAQHPETAGMGSTVVAALVLGRDLYVAHVGDSRAYRARGDFIEPLTADHTLVAETMRLGAITPQEAETHPGRHVLSRSLGGGPEVEVDLSCHRLRPDDRVVLATDGLTRVVSDAEIRDAVTDQSPEAAAQALGELATRRGSKDDVTVLVIDPFGSPVRVAAEGRSWLRCSSWLAILSGTLLALLVLGGVVWYAGWPGGRLPPGPGGEALTLPATPEVDLTAPLEAYPPASSSAPRLLGSPAPLLPDRADVNGDGVVDIRDLTRIGGVYGQPASADPASDVNGDGQINLFDLVIVASAYERRQ